MARFDSNTPFIVIYMNFLMERVNANDDTRALLASEFETRKGDAPINWNALDTIASKYQDFYDVYVQFKNNAIKPLFDRFIQIQWQDNFIVNETLDLIHGQISSSRFELIYQQLSRVRYNIMNDYMQVCEQRCLPYKLAIAVAFYLVRKNQYFDSDIVLSMMNTTVERAQEIYNEIDMNKYEIIYALTRPRNLAQALQPAPQGPAPTVPAPQPAPRAPASRPTATIVRPSVSAQDLDHCKQAAAMIDGLLASPAGFAGNTSPIEWFTVEVKPLPGSTSDAQKLYISVRGEFQSNNVFRVDVDDVRKIDPEVQFMVTNRYLFKIEKFEDQRRNIVLELGYRLLEDEDIHSVKLFRNLTDAQLNSSSVMKSIFSRYSIKLNFHRTILGFGNSCWYRSAAVSILVRTFESYNQRWALPIFNFFLSARNAEQLTANWNQTLQTRVNDRVSHLMSSSDSLIVTAMRRAVASSILANKSRTYREILLRAINRSDRSDENVSERSALLKLRADPSKIADDNGNQLTIVGQFRDSEEVLEQHLRDIVLTFGRMIESDELGSTALMHLFGMSSTLILREDLILKPYEHVPDIALEGETAFLPLGDQPSDAPWTVGKDNDTRVRILEATRNGRRLRLSLRNEDIVPQSFIQNINGDPFSVGASGEINFLERQLVLAVVRPFSKLYHSIPVVVHLQPDGRARMKAVRSSDSGKFHKDLSIYIPATDQTKVVADNPSLADRAIYVAGDGLHNSPSGSAELSADPPNPDLTRVLRAKGDFSFEPAAVGDYVRIMSRMPPIQSQNGTIWTFLDPSSSAELLPFAGESISLRLEDKQKFHLSVESVDFINRSFTTNEAIVSDGTVVAPVVLRAQLAVVQSKQRDSRSVAISTQKLSLRVRIDDAQRWSIYSGSVPSVGSLILSVDRNGDVGRDSSRVTGVQVGRDGKIALTVSPQSRRRPGEYNFVFAATIAVADVHVSLLTTVQTPAGWSVQSDMIRVRPDLDDTRYVYAQVRKIVNADQNRRDACNAIVRYQPNFLSSQCIWDKYLGGYVNDIPSDIFISHMHDHFTVYHV